MNQKKIKKVLDYFGEILYYLESLGFKSLAT